MGVVIIREENAVNVNGVRRTVDCSDMPNDVHVVQWDGTRGEVEYVPTYVNGILHKKPNLTITDFEPYAKYIGAWHAAGPKD